MGHLPWSIIYKPLMNDRSNNPLHVEYSNVKWLMADVIANQLASPKRKKGGQPFVARLC
jgi:hypothetical protein